MNNLNDIFFAPTANQELTYEQILEDVRRYFAEHHASTIEEAGDGNAERAASLLKELMIPYIVKRKYAIEVIEAGGRSVKIPDKFSSPQHAMLLKVFMFQLTILFLIRTADGRHIVFKSPLNPHVAHVAVALQPLALQPAGSLEGLLEYPPPFVCKASIIIIKGLFLPWGDINPYIVRMMVCGISLRQQPLCQIIVFLILILFHSVPPYSPWQGRIPK